jgi:hypothetical protein
MYYSIDNILYLYIIILTVSLFYVHNLFIKEFRKNQTKVILEPINKDKDLYMKVELILYKVEKLFEENSILRNKYNLIENIITKLKSDLTEKYNKYVLSVSMEQKFYELYRKITDINKQLFKCESDIINTNKLLSKELINLNIEFKNKIEKCHLKI